MNIQTLKTMIENKERAYPFMIFKDDSDHFLSNHYINSINKLCGVEIEYIQDLHEVLDTGFDFFTCATDEQPENLRVLYSSVYSWGEVDTLKLSNVIVVVTKFDNKETEKKLAENIISFPKLEDWQIKDYVYSLCEGVDHKDLDWLISVCGNNIGRLQQELDKIVLFKENERKYFFSSFIHDGALDDLSSFNIFNFTNAILTKNIPTLTTIYKELTRMDVNEFGLLTILLKNFKNMVLVHLQSNPTPENTGLDSRQLYAIKKTPNVFTHKQLVDVYEFLCGVDSMIKEGNLPTELTIDYMLIKILSM